MPKVSIIIAAYNTEKYIRTALDSIFNQTLEEIEVIVVDDGSTDSTKDIIESFRKKYEFKYISHSTNKKLGQARNEGIKNATGEYIMFVDSDDYIIPTAAEELYNEATDDNADIVIFDYVLKRLNKNKRELVSTNFEDGQIIPREVALKELLMQKNGIKGYACMKFFKTSLIKENNIMFDDRLSTLEDVLFSFIAFFYSEKVKYVNRYLYYYYKRLGSNTNQINTNAIDSYKSVVDQIKRFMLKNKILSNNINEYNGMVNRHFSMVMNKIIYLQHTREEKIQLLNYAIEQFEAEKNIIKLGLNMYYNENTFIMTNIAILMNFNAEEIIDFTEKYRDNIEYI